jgi:hypothetical protein
MDIRTVLEHPVLSFMELLPHLQWALICMERSSQIFQSFHGSQHWYSPTCHFEGCVGDVIVMSWDQEVLPLVHLCAVRLHSHATYRRKIAPAAQGFLIILERPEKKLMRQHV